MKYPPRRDGIDPVARSRARRRALQAVYAWQVSGGDAGSVIAQFAHEQANHVAIPRGDLFPDDEPQRPHPIAQPQRPFDRVMIGDGNSGQAERETVNLDVRQRRVAVGRVFCV